MKFALSENMDSGQAKFGLRNFSLELKPNNHIYTSVHVTRENIHLSQTDSTLF